jgi:hypothetical protein
MRGMGEEAGKAPGDPRGDAAESRRGSAQAASDSGWVTTEVAAAALRVPPRTVRDYVRAGDLEAIPEGEGVRKRWLVSIEAVQEMRERRRAAGYPPRSHRDAAVDEHTVAADASASTVDAAELVAQLQELQYRLGRAEARVELQAVAESTVREERDRLLAELGEEHERAKRLEAELREARQPPPETPRSPDIDEGGHYGTSREEAEESLHKPSEGRERSWWRRFFGFE